MDSHNLSTQRQLVQTVIHYRYRATLFFTVTVLLAVLGLALCPQKYESEAKLFVRVGRENALLDPTVGSGTVVALQASREIEMNSIVEHLGSRYIVEKALETMDPSFAALMPEEREQRLKKTQKSIRIVSPRRSTIIRINGRAASPRSAQDTVATLVDVYLDEHMRINRTSGSYKFFVEQAELLKSQLDDAENSLRDTKSKFGFTSIEDRRRALENQASDIERQLAQLAIRIAASNAKMSTLRIELEDLPDEMVAQLVGGTPNDGLAAMRERVFQLRMRERELLSVFTPEHFKAKAMRKQVEEVESQLRSEEPKPGETINAVLAMETATRDALLAEEASLKLEQDKLRLRLEAINEHDTLIQRLTREAQQLESRYLAYLDNSEQARIDRALQADRISNVSIVQPASFVPDAVSPSVRLVLAVAALFGIFGGIGLAIVSKRAVPGSGKLSRRSGRRVHASLPDSRPCVVRTY